MGQGVTYIHLWVKQSLFDKKITKKYINKCVMLLMKFKKKIPIYL